MPATPHDVRFLLAGWRVPSVLRRVHLPKQCDGMSAESIDIAVAAISARTGFVGIMKKTRVSPTWYCPWSAR